MTTQYMTSIRHLNAAKKWETMKKGMTVEYSDPANDMDDGNFGVVLYRDLIRRRRVNGEGYYIFDVYLRLSNGREVKISAGQVLAYIL